MKSKTFIILMLMVFILCINIYAQDNDIEEDNNEESEKSFFIGVSAGIDNFLKESNTFISPLLQYKKDDIESKLQWQPYILPDRTAGSLEFSVLKEFNFKEFFILELENEYIRSLTDEDHEGVFIIENTFNLLDIWLGVEFPFTYIPERKMSAAPVIEYGYEGETAEIKLELTYLYQVAPDKEAEEFEAKIKYEQIFHDNIELNIELISSYDFQGKEYLPGAEIAVSYGF